MIADWLLRTAHATCPVETWAQDGLPIPVALPVDLKLPQDPHASGHTPSKVNKANLATRVIILDFVCSPYFVRPGKLGRAFSVSLK
jgi:hypothetical protein